MSIAMQDVGLDAYIAHLRRRERFALARYGDGEWRCIMAPKASAMNCDGNHYYPGLGAALGETLRNLHDEPYYYGIQPYALRTDGKTIEAWCDQNAAGVQWRNGDVLHQASIHGELAPFLKALMTRPVVMVGPSCLLSLPLSCRCYVSTEGVDMWTQADGLCERIEGAVRVAGKDAVVCCALGLCAEVVIHRLWPRLKTATLIDVGSVFDAYVSGGRKRSYFAKLSEATKLANMEIGQ